MYRASLCPLLRLPWPYLPRKLQRESAACDKVTGANYVAYYYNRETTPPLLLFVTATSSLDFCFNAEQCVVETSNRSYYRNHRPCHLPIVSPLLPRYIYSSASQRRVAGQLPVTIDRPVCLWVTCVKLREEFVRFFRQSNKEWKTSVTRWPDNCFNHERQNDFAYSGCIIFLSGWETTAGDEQEAPRSRQLSFISLMASRGILLLGETIKWATMISRQINIAIKVCATFAQQIK